MRTVLIPKRFVLLCFINGMMKVISRSFIDKLYLCCKTGGNLWGCPPDRSPSYVWGCPPSTPAPTGTINVTCMLHAPTDRAGNDIHT